MKRLRNTFILCAAALFAVTGLLKLVGLAIGAVNSARPDPALMMVPLWATMGVAAALELGCASLCFSRASYRLKLFMILWLSGLFASYRVCLWLEGKNPECPCLGYLVAGGPQFRMLIFHTLGWFIAATFIACTLFLLDEWMAGDARASRPRHR
jgi:hypothetical protein